MSQSKNSRKRSNTSDNLSYSKDYLPNWQSTDIQKKCYWKNWHPYRKNDKLFLVSSTIAEKSPNDTLV